MWWSQRETAQSRIGCNSDWHLQAFLPMRRRKCPLRSAFPAAHSQAFKGKWAVISWCRSDPDAHRLDAGGHCCGCPKSRSVWRDLEEATYKKKCMTTVKESFLIVLEGYWEQRTFFNAAVITTHLSHSHTHLSAGTIAYFHGSSMNYATETKVNLEFFFPPLCVCVCLGHLWRWTWFSKGWFANFQSKSSFSEMTKCNVSCTNGVDCAFMHIPSMLQWQKSPKVLPTS